MFLEIGAECPPFKNYLEKNIEPWAADWSGWYYPKKNIAQGKCQLLQQSVIPEQGQFHVSLNAAEDTVLIFKHFFDDLYKSVFRQDLPNKPRTYEVTVCLTAALLGESATKVWHLQRPMMNLSQSSTYLNMCFLLCFSFITFSAVQIPWNMRI